MTTRQPRTTQLDKLQALHVQLVQQVEELATSEAWKRMLQAAARFHHYSPANILLITAQRPDATQVAGYRTWTTLGRHVKKGEHGIAILAPCTYTSTDTPATTGTINADRTGETRLPTVNPDEQNLPRHLRGFRIVHVFDVTQTDGEPLPDITPRLLHGEAPPGLIDHLTDLTQQAGFTVERGPCHGANGYTNFTTHTVRILDTVSPAQVAKTLAHELGHIRADHQHRFTDYATNTTCRGQAEIEAESIAYLITTTAGLNPNDYSVPYLAGWSGGDTNLLRDAMTQVVTIARHIAPDPARPSRTAAVTTPHSTPAIADPSVQAAHTASAGWSS